MRRSSLPGAMSLAEAYNVMAVDVSCIVLLLFLLFATRINKLFLFQRTAVLATINMLSAME
jgi:D-alanyl-lipoteichoic acid acyltransferase DltB (MBOAT superfamily)